MRYNNRAPALNELIPLLSDNINGVLCPLWQSTLPILASRTRAALLSDLRALTPLIHKLGGDKAITGTFRAIQDVCRWWP